MIKLKELLPESTAVSRYYDKNPSKLTTTHIRGSGKDSKGDELERLLTQLFPSEKMEKPFVQFEEYGSIVDKYLHGFTKTVEKAGWSDNPIARDVLSRLDGILKKKGGIEYELGRDTHDILGDFMLKAYADGKLTKLRNSPEYKKFLMTLKPETYYKSLLSKTATRLGVSSATLETALAELKRIQSQSYQKLKPEAYEVMRKLTVGRKPLPRAIYRGMFFDGAKVKDAKKFEAQWAIGRSPNVGLGKPTSWSASKVVAKSFTMPQDGIKDDKNGYMVILRLDNPTKDDIIVDMNALGGGRFWNQVEYIVDPKCKRWVVDDINRGFDTKSRLHNPVGKIEKKSIELQSTTGYGRGEAAMNPFIIPSLQLPIDDKVEMMGWQNKTLKDVQTHTLGSYENATFVYPFKTNKYSNCSVALAGYMFCLGIGIVRRYVKRFDEDAVDADSWDVKASKSSVSITVMSSEDKRKRKKYTFDFKMNNESFTNPKVTLTLGNDAKGDVKTMNTVMKQYEGGPVAKIDLVINKLKNATSIR